MLINTQGKLLFSLYLIVWLSIAISLWIFWNEMSLYLIMTLSFIEMIFAPDIKSIKMLFGYGKDEDLPEDM